MKLASSVIRKGRDVNYINSFEDLDVWKAGRDLRRRVYSLAKRLPDFDGLNQNNVQDVHKGRRTRQADPRAAASEEARRTGDPLLFGMQRVNRTLSL